MLLYLERSGLFVRSRDSDLQWFEYHGLFQSFLVEQLRHRSETVELECHRAAAQWHLKRHNFEDVVHHAICCGDFSFAATTLDTWGGRLISGAHLITMERWFDRIPFEEVASRRSLLIKCAWALVFLRRRDKLKPLLALLERCQPPFDVRETTDPSIVLSMAAIACDDARSAFRIVDKVPLRTSDVGGFAAFELGAAANLTSFRQLAYGDFEGARDLLSVARAHGDRADANFSRGYTIGVDSVSLLLQGRLPDALDKLKVGSAEQRVAVDRSYATAALACCYIWGLYEANELDMAEALFGQYHDVIADAALLDFLAVAQVSMARIHDVRGRPSKAIATLEEAEAVGHANDSRRYIRLLNWERVRRALLADDIERAQAIADRCSGTPDDKEDPWLLFSEDLEGASLGRIRLAIYCDELELAGELLEREMHRQRTRTFRQIKLHLLDVQLQRRRDSKNVAQRSLRKALQLAAPGRYIRCFLDEGEVVLALLREEFQSLNDSTGREVPGKADRRFVEQLLQASGTDLSRLRRSEERLLLEPLTDKQMEILTFLANGVTNKEMSERLSVSENTVKFHLKNIYSKLAVTSRLQAIASARELGLVK
jgi:LuxR family maltose regulon positive regulatory protein